MILFAGFFGAAVKYRNKPEIHKRLILAATVALAFAAVARMGLRAAAGLRGLDGADGRARGVRCPIDRRRSPGHGDLYRGDGARLPSCAAGERGMTRGWPSACAMLRPFL